MSKFKPHKEFVGDNFWHFYFNSKLSYISFSITLLILTLLIISITYPTDPYVIFHWKTISLSIINAILISFITVDKKRDFYKRKNKFINDLEEGRSVHSKEATKEFHHIINDCLNSEDSILVETEVGVVEKKVGEIPDRNLKSFVEILKEMREILVTSSK